MKSLKELMIRELSDTELNQVGGADGLDVETDPDGGNFNGGSSISESGILGWDAYGGPSWQQSNTFQPANARGIDSDGDGRLDDNELQFVEGNDSAHSDLFNQ